MYELFLSNENKRWTRFFLFLSFQLCCAFGITTAKDLEINSEEQERETSKFDTAIKEIRVPRIPFVGEKVLPIIDSCRTRLRLKGVDIGKVEIENVEARSENGMRSFTINHVLGKDTLCSETYSSFRGSDNLVLVVLQDETVRYFYDSESRMVGSRRVDHKSRNGLVEEFSYTYCENGLLCSIDGPRTDIDDRMIIEYDDDGQITSLRNAYGYKFPILGNGTYEREDWRLLTEVTDELITRNEVSSTEPSNGKSSLHYHESTNKHLNKRSVRSKKTFHSTQILGIPNPVVEVIATLGTDSPSIRKSIQIVVDRDGFERPEMLHTPNESTEVRFNEASQVSYIQDSNGNHFEWFYDEVGRVVSAVGINGSAMSEVRFQYDDCEHGLGQICSVSSNNLTTRYLYDSSGLIRRIDSYTAGSIYSTSFDYEDSGALRQTQFSNGMQIAYRKQEKLDSQSISVIRPESEPLVIELRDLRLNSRESGTLHQLKSIEEFTRFKEGSNLFSTLPLTVSSINIEMHRESVLSEVRDLFREAVHLPDGRILFELLYEDLNKAPSYLRVYIWHEKTLHAFWIESLSKEDSSNDVFFVLYDSTRRPYLVQDETRQNIARIRRESKETYHDVMDVSTMSFTPGQLIHSPWVNAYIEDDCSGISVYMNRCLAYMKGMGSYSQLDGVEYIPSPVGEGGRFNQIYSCVETSSADCPLPTEVGEPSIPSEVINLIAEYQELKDANPNNPKIWVPKFTDFTPYGSCSSTNFKGSEYNNRDRNDKHDHNFVICGNMTFMAEGIRSKYNEQITGSTNYGILISSGWRCPDENKMLRDSVADSQHQYGNALDLKPAKPYPSGSLSSAMRILEIAIDQFILENGNIYQKIPKKNYIHIEYDP